ncbi:MAG: T9SS type A sorting domain-containing protein, partial [Bacteroidota bacterium]|nr:T9SS type A sorting domain-containing protein [Bacteroidota bacterium]
CMDLMVSYCEQDPVWVNGMALIALGCPADSTIGSWVDGWPCENGNMNNIFTGLEPGQYLIPVLFDPVNDGTQYTIEVSGIWCGLVGIDTHADLVWSIFPTPGRDRFTIRNGNPIEIVSIRVIDTAGRIQSSSDRSIPAHSDQEIILGGISPGVYMVQVELSDKRILQKYWIAGE